MLVRYTGGETKLWSVVQAPTVEQAAAKIEAVAQAESLELEAGVARLIAEHTQAVPRDCLGVLYDLSFDGPKIELAAAQAVLVND